MERSWISRHEIRHIDGALKSSAYVQRAYMYSRDHDGAAPDWARKDEQGQWLFDEDHIRHDAWLNRETISVSEAARVLGATRRAVQNWVDEGVIAVLQRDRHTGDVRHIHREAFLQKVPELKKRLKAPAVVGFKREQRKKRQTATRLARGPKTEKELIASELEARLREARDVHREDEAGRRPVPGGVDKAMAAQAIEDQLRGAVEDRRREAEFTEAAKRIAGKILDDMFDERFHRIEAMKLYNDTAERDGIPREIRIRVRKEFFGR